MSLSKATLGVLRLADRRLRAIKRGDRPSVYRTCRIAMETIAPVDAFYIALIHDDATTVFPYSFDHGMYVDPDILPYRRGGLTHWIMSSKRTYRWSDDDGALIHRGVPFGAADERSQDALVTPLLNAGDPDADVVGLMSVQSYTANVFTDEHRLALEWLAQAAMTTIARDAQDRERDRMYALYPELDTTVITGLADLVGHIGLRVGEIRRSLAEIAERPGVASDDELSAAVAAVDASCEDLQIEAADASTLAEGSVQDSPRPILTKREAEVVQLIAQDCSNREIAQRLCLSEKTVKAHVTKILKKFNVTQRSAVAWQVRSWSDVLEQD